MSASKTAKVSTSPTPEESLAAIALHVKNLAAHRLPLLEALKAKAEAADLPGLGAEMTSILTLMPEDQSKQILRNFATGLPGFISQLEVAISSAKAVLEG